MADSVNRLAVINRHLTPNKSGKLSSIFLKIIPGRVCFTLIYLNLIDSNELDLMLLVWLYYYFYSWNKFIHSNWNFKFKTKVLGCLLQWIKCYMVS